MKTNKFLILMFVLAVAVSLVALDPVKAAAINAPVTGSTMEDWDSYDISTVASLSLSTPVLRSPGIDAIVYGGRPTFKWYKVSGATQYNVRLINASNVILNTWKVTPACADFCEYRMPYDLETNYGDYKWRVQALNGAESSAWSSARTFSYIQLERTWLISPADGYTSHGGSPLLEWGDITGATMYLMQIRRASDSALIVQQLVTDAGHCDGSTCGWEVDPALLDGDYIWHVRSKNGRNFGRWTAYWNLSINPADYYYDFNTESSDWIDPNNTWSVVSGIYRGIQGTCSGYACATTYLNANFTDGTMNSYMKSAGTDPGKGFSIYYRAQFDVNGNLVKAYTIDVVSNESNELTFTFWRYESPNWYSLGSPIIKTGYNITDFHTYSVDVNGTTMTLRLTPGSGGSDILIGKVTGIDSSFSSGFFAIDVISYETSHNIDIDWIQIDNTDYESSSVEMPSYTPAVSDMDYDMCASNKENAPLSLYGEVLSEE